MPLLFDLIQKNKVLLFIIAITFLVRIPSLFEPLWYGDEAIYMVIGKKIGDGWILYRDLFDHKTPGIYYLATIAIKLLGTTIWSFKMLLMVWVIATLFSFYALAKKLFNHKTALIAVAALAALTSTPLLEGNIVNSELLMILPTSLGLLFVLDKKYFWGGVFFSLAVLLKVPAFFDFAAVGLLVTLNFDPKNLPELVKKLFSLLVGFALPILLTVFYFYLEGALSEYVNSALFFNVSYTNYGNFLLIPNGLLILKALPILVLVAFFLIRAFRSFEKGRSHKLSIFEFLVVWLVFSFYAAVFGGRPYEHYLIQVLPAFTLILASFFSFPELRRKTAGFLTLVLVLVFLLGFKPNFSGDYYLNFFSYIFGQKSFEEYTRGFGWNAEVNYALSSFLTGCEKFEQERCLQKRTSPGDPLYIFANEPSIYFLSDLSPTSKWITFFHIAGDQTAKRKVAEEVLLKNPRFILVQTPNVGHFAELEKILNDQYNLFAFYETVAVYKMVKNPPGQ